MALEEVIAGVSGQDLNTAIRELQDLRVDVLAGAAAGTNIALAAIETDDTIKAAILLKDPGAAATAAAVKLTPTPAGGGVAAPGIPVDGQVRFVEATNAAAGDRIVLLWHKKPADTTG
jgi:hypothetical protein